MKKKKHDTPKQESSHDPIPILNFPIVGIGASAGGLAAFEAFFSGMPTDMDSGMAFVLVQHLAPDHKSILTELIKRYTRMPVTEVEDGMVVQPNHTYIIPPGYNMAFLNGALHLLSPLEAHGHRMPIDFFFRSLAQDQHNLAIGIVLSGTGSDGTLGVRAIKGEGGMVMAQKNESTEFDGMPRSCIATGLVDYELAPDEMPAQLIAYANRAFSKTSRPHASELPMAETAINKIFILLRAQTSHDFSQYKPSTIHRRIERRMAVHQIESLDHYVKYLQQTPDEVEALFRDLLIGVTNFFRDPEAFKALEEEAIPKLFEGKDAGSAIRVWSAGCSTGEEAYSIAILLVERMQALKQNFAIQIFATDIDIRAIATARAGLYPANVAADISPERLARFFTIEADGKAYRIHKNIRDLMVFSEQNLIKDPPFSRLDLIVCRNLLIYLSGDLQKKLIPLFHYALNPDGVLFLGVSEGVGEFGDLFGVMERKARLYLRKANHLGERPNLHFPRLKGTDAPPRFKHTQLTITKRSSLRELTEQTLLKETAPVAILVNEKGDLLYLHGRAGMFLEPPAGEVGVNNILKMARDGLRPGLSAALRKAVASKDTTSCPNLRLNADGGSTRVNVTIHPVLDSELTPSDSPLYLVVLKEAPLLEIDHAVSADLPKGEPGLDARILALQTELGAKEDDLQNIQTELERSNEEFKSFNEELQSVNEELQSTNEELETSKEEMQSVNEELATVNTELQIKVSELSQANNDISNLLAGTGIASVFVDHQLNILRFTPAAATIIHLIPGDVGRPVSHIVSNLIGYDQLSADIQTVLDNLIFKELEVKTADGKWYSMRIQPYRTISNMIEGAVISFIDITEMQQTREALRLANDQLRMAVVVRDSHDAITVQDLEGITTAWNPAAERMYGWSEVEALEMNSLDRIPTELREQELDTLVRLSRAEVPKAHLTQRITKDGKVIKVSIISSALINKAGKLYAIATTERTIHGGKT
jgi:two-component system CheB/CheR fusion protein